MSEVVAIANRSVTAAPAIAALNRSGFEIVHEVMKPPKFQPTPPR
jgi:hypothetical protein